MTSGHVLPFGWEKAEADDESHPHNSNSPMARVCCVGVYVFDCSFNYCTVSRRAASWPLATASTAVAASTAAPLPAVAAIASTSGRATFTFSRCTVQEAVIQSLHQLSRSEGKAKEEEEKEEKEAE